MNFKRVLVAGVLVELLIIVFVIWSEGATLTALQTITRYSGRLSLAVFSVVFLLYNAPGNLNAYLFVKPYHFFAMVHGIHLAELLVFVSLSSIPLSPVRMLGGFVAYALIFTMPVLSNFQQKAKVSLKTFKVTEVLFQYYIWFVFFMTYFPRVQGKMHHAGGDYWEHVALLGWVSVLLGIKVTGLMISKTRRAGQ